MALPAVVFLDEIDAMVGKRGMSGEEGDGDAATGVQGRVLSTLLNEMDGVVTCDGLIVLAATNRVDMIDEALLRPGRFDRLVSVPLPDIEDREAILRIHCEKIPLETACHDMLGEIARRTHGKSGAELEALCREAAMHALRAGQSTVAMHNFFNT
jgi:transitional endoplasmic reticulum ATPase